MKEFKVNFMDEEITVAFMKGKYELNDRLFIGCIAKNEDGYWEDFCDITKNLPVELEDKYPLDSSAFLDENNLPHCIDKLIMMNGWMSMLNHVVRTGFTQYPLVMFSDEFLNDVCGTEIIEE